MKRSAAGRYGASAALAAMVTAGFGWLPVLLGWLIGACVMAWSRHIRGREPGNGAAVLTLIGCAVLMSAILLGADAAFPARTTFPFVSAGLLLVLWRAMIGREGGMADAAVILGVILLPVLGTVILFGLEDVKWAETVPGGLPWGQLWISAAATCPWWGSFQSKGEDRADWAWFGAGAAVSLGASLLTRGILGSGLAVWEPSPLYRAVQTIRILGVLQRLEAFLAAAVLLGAFILLLMTAEKAALAMKKLFPDRPLRRRKFVFLAAVFLLEWAVRIMPEAGQTVAETAFWGLLPAFTLWVVFFTKYAETP